MGAATASSLSGDIEIVEKFQRSYRLVRTPLKSVPAEVLRRAAPECRYIVTDENDRVVLAEVAPLGADANFQIDLKGPAAARPLHPCRRHRRQRQCHERRDQAHPCRR